MLVIKSKVLTEFKMQNILFNWSLKKGHQFAIPNTYLYNWESDMISVTKSDYVHEYEIKRSKADFNADFVWKDGKHNLLCEHKDVWYRPSYFWFVMPEDLVDIKDVPDYAGLLYIGKYNKVKTIRKAPKMSKVPATNKQIKKVLLGSMYRYWDVRLKLDKLEEENAKAKV